jgi:hypothetical protein
MKAFRYLTGVDDASFCHKVTAALNGGWSLQGPPILTFDSKLGRVACEQAIVKDAPDTTYRDTVDPSKL